MAKYNLGNGNDHFSGTNFDDEIYGNGGADYIHALDGDDFVNGGIGDDSIAGGKGNDWLLGGIGTDTINGEEGNDTIRDQAGNDTYYGGEGNDTLEAGYGNDHLYAGPGDDVLRMVMNSVTLSGGDHAWMYGGTGDDTYMLNDYFLVWADLPSIYENAGEGVDAIGFSSSFWYHRDSYTLPANVENLWINSDTRNELVHGDGVVYGNALDNTIEGADYLDDELHGGAGDDRLVGKGGWDALYGDDGRDTLDFSADSGSAQPDGGNGWGGKGDDLYVVGAGNEVYVHEHADEGFDTVQTERTSAMLGPNLEALTYTGVTSATLLGNDQANWISGSVGDDYLSGDAGNDTLYGNSGADHILGDAGADFIKGGMESDRLEGGAGNDMLYGDDHDDLLYGQADNDLLWGGAGRDSLYGGDQDDRLYGEDGIDWLFGGQGSDQLFGGQGMDYLDGEAGADTLRGGTEADRLLGGDGADVLYGDEGDDELTGGQGADRLYGGAGSDRFKFTGLLDSVTLLGVDQLMDFQRGSDKIDLSGIDADPFNAGDQTFNPVAEFTGHYCEVKMVTGASSTMVYADTDGDLRVDFTLEVMGQTGLAWSDFVF